MSLSANRNNLPDYQYRLYNDYLTQLDDILLLYGKQNAMNIQYWHIRVDLSKNFDDLQIQNSYKHYVYDILHFMPTLNAAPLTYQIGYNLPYQGTSNVAVGSFSIYVLDKPLPGDLFRFYPQDDTTDGGEIFRVTNVRYMRTAKNKLTLYEIEFETAPILIETLNHVRINQILCWDSAEVKFLTEEICEAKQAAVEEVPAIVDEINKYYDPINGWYGLCKDASGNFNCTGSSVEQPLVFLNTILKRLKKRFGYLDLKPIFGIGTAKIPIEWIMDPRDFWDTFSCLSFQPTSTSGEIFNVTQILAGNCVSCPQELLDKIECYRDLIPLIKSLVELLAPLMTQEELSDHTCDRRCCDAADPNYIQQCVTNYGSEFNQVFWNHEGPIDGTVGPTFCEQYSNALCIPLYISWRDGAHWPEGRSV